MMAYDVPESSRAAKGQALVNFLELSDREKVSAVLAISSEAKDQPKFLTMVTVNGVIKKTALEDFANVRRSGLAAIKLKGEDALRWVRATDNQDEIILVTALGQAIRFSEKDLRPMGRSASGVTGMRLAKGDNVVGMNIIKSKIKNQNSRLLVVMEGGFGKMSLIKDYRLQKRGGSGIKTAKINDKTGQIIAAMIVDEQNLPETAEGDILIISQSGQVIRLPIKSVKLASRSTQGVRLMRFKETKDKVASVTLV
jgi:DNA gyrase subunit A